MILRRLAQNLKQQNWTTILVELVLLVCGVFLGIQAANWNEQRAEDSKAQAYLARFHGNLETDLQSIDRRVVFWSQVIDDGKAAIHYAETGELGLIRDDAMRDALSEYYVSSGDGTDYLFYLQPEYRKLVRGLTPSVVADHVWAKCWQQPKPAEQFLLDCDSPISEAHAQAVLAGYMQDPQLLRELRFWVANQGVALAVIKNYQPMLRDMLARPQAHAAP